MSVFKGEAEYCLGSNMPGIGQRKGYVKCDYKTDVNKCLSSKPRGTVGWQSCDTQSSPGGALKNHTGNKCRPPTSDFSCRQREMCYAITKNNPSFSCSPLYSKVLSGVCSFIVFIVFILIIIKSFAKSSTFKKTIGPLYP